MANLDPRLFPLFELLARAGLDWLVSETIDGVLAGHVPEVTREKLLRARKAALRSQEHAWERESLADDVAAEPFRPFAEDEQVEWAVLHVMSRLTEAIAMMAASLERVDTILDKEDQIAPKVDRQSKAMLVLTDGDARIETTERELVVAANALEDLRVALDQWSAEVLGAGGET